MTYTKILGAILISLCLVACSNTPTAIQPVSVIIDTDCGPDYDDVGALAAAFALESQSKCKILAVISSNLNREVIPCIQLINEYFNRADIPVGEIQGQGVDLTGWHKQSWSTYLINKYSSSASRRNNIYPAVALYRKLLAGAKDSSITICTIGFLTNLSELLLSQPDQYSPLAGRELVAQKVAKLYAMGGGFPEGNEYNINQDPKSSINVVDIWPTPIYFCGFEVGDKVITGKQTAAMEVENNPIADAYRVALAQDDPKGRNSWDQVTVLASINGIEPYFTLKQGRIKVNQDGSNGWQDSSSGQHFYMVPKVTYTQLEKEIEQLMMYVPDNKK